MNAVTRDGGRGPSLPQDPTAAAVLDSNGVLLWSTRALQDLLGYPADELHGTPGGQLWADREAYSAALTAVLRHSPTTGPAVLRHHDGHPVEAVVRVLPLEPSHDREFSGCCLVLAAPVADAAQTAFPAQVAAPDRRLELLRAAACLDASSDAARTAEELAALLVADFADVVAVDLAEAVQEGGELPAVARFGELRMRRMAALQHRGSWPEGLPARGSQTPTVSPTPLMHPLQHGHAVLINDIEAFKASLHHDPDLIRLVLPAGAHSGLSVPLFARGLLLGGITLWRLPPNAPFEQDDAALIEQIASLSALTLDNTRRYLREQRAAVALQSSLLPRLVSESAAAETVGLYVPAVSEAGVSGDWFDVIPLPCLRTAFVIGDVVGHGIYAAATMGRLRTAVQTLADMDLEPDELLTHLDDLVARLAAQQEAGPGPSAEFVGATCLYGVYDPSTHRCVLASAGHPPPVHVRPDGMTELTPVSPGPPLGVGAMPFEPVEVTLEPGSVLAFYTDGLLGFPGGDVGLGLERLQSWLEANVRPERSLEELGRRALDTLVDNGGPDDVAALLVRTRVIPAGDTISWEFPADPSLVGEAREKVTRQLTAWGLDKLAFTTELIISELVTNAIRYAGGPVVLRLIRHQVLVCEVSDPSSTQPRLRRARTTDEGGRGLFLVAQLADRWGSRYTRSGKTIWTEQVLGTKA